MKRLFLLLSLMLALMAFPALAQEVTHTVAFDSFSFAFPHTLATNVSITQHAGDAPTVEQPGGPEVRHTQFELYSGSLTQEDYLGTGSIRIYNIVDFAGYTDAEQQVSLLQTLLAQRPDLTPYMTVDPAAAENNLPFLPVAPGSQIIRARANYVETPSFQGIRYITLHRLDVSPIVGSEFRYTFQGISTDATRYVAVNLALNTGLFPAEIGQDFDIDAFSQQFESYLNESTATLNNAMPEDFTPSLTALDAVIQSLALAGAASPPPVDEGPAPATPTTEASAMGGLAGPTWLLVAYGSPEESQAVLENTPVSLIFDEMGLSGSAGCNSYSSSFQFDNNLLTIGIITTTMMACEQPIMDQEMAYLSALQTVTSYQTDGSLLQLFYEGGVLTFTAA